MFVLGPSRCDHKGRKIRQLCRGIARTHCVPIVIICPHISSRQYRTHKLIYRRYAALFFTLCVDVNDTELVKKRAEHIATVFLKHQSLLYRIAVLCLTSMQGYLEAIHLFVEILDQYVALPPSAPSSILVTCVIKLVQQYNLHQSA